MDEFSRKLTELRDSIDTKERELRNLRKSLDALWQEYEEMLARIEAEKLVEQTPPPVETAAPIQAAEPEEEEQQTPEEPAPEREIAAAAEPTPEPAAPEAEVAETPLESPAPSADENPQDSHAPAPSQEPITNFEAPTPEPPTAQEPPVHQAPEEPQAPQAPQTPVAAPSPSEASESPALEETPAAASDDKDLRERIQTESASMMVGARPSIQESAPGDRKTVGDIAARKKIIDLKRAMGINERFLYANELFGGDMSAFNQAIQELNHISSLQDANRMMNEQLVSKYNWDEESEVTISFRDLVDRRFV